MLATKISFMNEVAISPKLSALTLNWCGKVSALTHVLVINLSTRRGYGGSCFPKDVRALKHLAHAEGCEASILTAVHDTNQRQKNKLAERVMARLGANLTGKQSPSGVTFKPNTDDMREAPAGFFSRTSGLAAARYARSILRPWRSVKASTASETI